jgi:pimeloyl-ACP methyl ester carboxylesterase
MIEGRPIIAGVQAGVTVAMCPPILAPLPEPVASGFMQRSEDRLQQPVTFSSDGLKLSGIVHVPEGLAPGERRPAIIMMHGFGANKNGGPEWVCRQFEKWGYVALRFDFRGCDDSEGERGRVIAMEEVADARNAVTYMAARPDVHPRRIALCGSSLGAGVAVHAAAVDSRVGAVILENGLGHGERIIRSMHTPESWTRFLGMMEDGIRHRERTGQSKIVHRFDIFEMPKELQVNLTSNNSLMHFTAETAVSFFMFRPEEMIGMISPRPVLILHSARDRVCNYEEAFSLARHAKPPFELHLLDGVDHFMFVDTDPRVAATLLSWLDKYFPLKESS